MLQVPRRNDGDAHQPREEPHARFDPGLIDEHAHDLAFIFPRNISFSVRGTTSMLPACNMRICSTIESTLWLAISETVFPSALTFSIPAIRKSRASTGPGKTA